MQYCSEKERIAETRRCRDAKKREKVKKEEKREKAGNEEMRRGGGSQNPDTYYALMV